MYRVEVYKDQIELATRMYPDYNQSHKMGLEELLHVYVNSKPGTWKLISVTNPMVDTWLSDTPWSNDGCYRSGVYVFFWSVPE